MSEKITDLIVILAARNNRYGQLDSMGQSRASAACRLITGLMRNRRGTQLIADGGFGPTFRQNPASFNPTDHALGVNTQKHITKLSRHVAQRMRPEVSLCRTTVEGAAFLKPIVEDLARKGNFLRTITVVTNDFHVNRTQAIFDALLGKVRGAPGLQVKVSGAPHLASLPPEERELIKAHEAKGVQIIRENVAKNSGTLPVYFNGAPVSVPKGPFVPKTRRHNFVA